MLILKAQNVVSEGIPIVYVYQMHQQNGSFAQNVDSEDIPGSTNGVNRKARNNKLEGDRAPPTSTNVLIYKMGWPPRLQFLAPFHISCNPDINKVGNRSYMLHVASTVDMVYILDTVYTVYTIQTALHCLNSSMYAYIYC